MATQRENEDNARFTTEVGKGELKRHFVYQDPNEAFKTFVAKLIDKGDALPQALQDMLDKGDYDSLHAIWEAVK